MKKGCEIIEAFQLGLDQAEIKKKERNLNNVKQRRKGDNSLGLFQ